MPLSNLKASVHYPLYERNKLGAKIIHIGLGAFHRGHQAFILHQLLMQQHADKANNDGWGFCSINLFGGQKIVDDLHKQNHLYTVLEKSELLKSEYKKSENNQATIIGSIIDSLQVDKDGIEAIIDKLCEAQVKIITLTITEKGYCSLQGLDLDLKHPLIIHDLANPNTPKSAIGLLYIALKRRFELGLPALTLLSCDNMPENGDALKSAVLSFTRAIDPDFVSQIEENIAFPSSMVDRIVPAITPESLDEVAVAIGQFDPCAIVTEPFIQWVIEDNFSAGRPQWDKVSGVSFVENVIPFEEMKLRMLNGSHSFLAYLGYLAGFEYISDCMANPHYKKACQHLMLKEQAITLSTLITQTINVDDYAQTLIARYENTGLKHRTWQIAMDGTQKIPQRFLASILWHIEHHQDYTLLALGIAAWMRYVAGSDDLGNVIDVRDPMAQQLKDVSAKADNNAAAQVLALLNIEAIFGIILPKNEQFIEKVTNAYQSLMTHGAQKTVVNYVNKIA